jgi:hypothetical protein
MKVGDLVQRRVEVYQDGKKMKLGVSNVGVIVEQDQILVRVKWADNNTAKYAAPNSLEIISES